MRKATLVATLAAPPSPEGTELAALSPHAEWLEVRRDLCGDDISPDWLRQHFKGRLIYTLRSRAEGGRASASASEREPLLTYAAKGYDLVSLEGARDLSDKLLAAIPASKRLVSWHGAAAGVAEMRDRFEQLASVPAFLYQLVPTALRSGDECAPLSLLNSLQRADVVMFADGATGFWSRMVAARFGAPFVFGAISNEHRTGCEPTVRQLVEDYGMPELMPLKELYGIVGNPVAHSLSPRLHNAAYRYLQHPALFVPFHVESFADFWREVVTGGALDALGITVRGLTVSSPHKEAALETVEQRSPMVRRAGSTNIFVRHNGHWEADTTDPQSVLQTTLERGIDIRHKRVAVVGCGGAGRAIAAALDGAGANVTIVNRGRERAEHAVELLHLPFVPLSEFSAEGFSMVVNATPVGRDDHNQPFEVEGLNENGVVVDLVYGAEPTPLVSRAQALGHTAIDGRDVLLAQVLRQFHLMTGKELSVTLARAKLGYEVEDLELIVAG
ncbi:MAG TPA: type I 3-dehydroquinate dehydratase [Pyrinomonadaceae bacterium]|nr:type I 3-dehydroquinate dehydratase [Pyrinomonadaceae bacterium]